MRLKPPFDELIPNISTFYERKMSLWKRMADIGSTFIGGPKTGVHYDKLAVEMPQIRAQWILLTRLSLKPVLASSQP
jgi:hypothetical protein